MINEMLFQSILKSAFDGSLTKQKKEEQVDIIPQIYNKDFKNIVEVNELNLPQNWKQFKLGNVITLISGQDLESTRYFPNYKENSIPYLTGASNIENDIVIINRYTDTPTSTAVKDDILLTCKGTIGTSIILKEEKVHIARQFMAIKPEQLNNEYLLYFLKSKVFDMQNNSKSMIPGIDRNYILNLTIPIPPMEEQQRIVDKLEELFIKLDYVKSIEVELKELKNNFPNDMKKSILKSAFSGEMNNEKPKMMNLEECLINIACKEYQIKQSDIKKVGKYPVVSQSKDIIEGYYDNELKLLKHNKPVLVYGDHSNNIKYVDFNFVIGADGTKVFECKDMFDEKYLYYNILFNLNFIPRNGYSRHYKYLKELPISYFPINIQKSIVNIIEKLFLLCDDLDNIISGN